MRSFLSYLLLPLLHPRSRSVTLRTSTYIKDQYAISEPYCASGPFGNV